MEVHYMVRVEDREKFAAIMNVAHYLVWKLFHEAWGIEEFPVCRFYFDQVDSRHCIVKEPEECLKTLTVPSAMSAKLLPTDSAVEYMNTASAAAHPL